ncbi:MAG: cobalamin biosynthesis protein [Desulfovibrio sp.]|nr:cobalamin biosynthesis protein [Desulfovibrio sp.]
MPLPQCVSDPLPVRERVLAIYALHSTALPLARRLARSLEAHPWNLPHTDFSLLASELRQCRLFVPARFCPEDAHAFDSLKAVLSRTYFRFSAHAFLGAAGIAVRCLAPFLTHKSNDAPVLVLDTAGRHVISLLSGHWGGGNDLARHVARLLDATPVITTASDVGKQPALDIELRNAGLRLLDWNLLPRVQGLLLDGKRVDLWDPCGAVPDHPLLHRLPVREEVPPAQKKEGTPLPMVAAHWKRLPSQTNVLRVAVPCLFLGVGCRRQVSAVQLEEAFQSVFQQYDLEPLSLVGLATVDAKLQEPGLRELAEQLRQPLYAFTPEDLADCYVPHPSEAAGRRFGLPPFSVCEAAAMLAAGKDGSGRLLVPKMAIRGKITMAVAMSMRRNA